MDFVAKVYSGDVYIGPIVANSLRGLKMIGSRKCNDYDSKEDTIVLSRAYDREVKDLKLIRYCRGKWEQEDPAKWYSELSALPTSLLSKIIHI